VTSSSQGSSFGAAASPIRSTDSIGFPIEDALPKWPEPLFERLGHQAIDDVNLWMRTIVTDIAALYPVLPTEAERAILTVVVNDSVALIRHVDGLDGRSAAHCARALFEHLVNAMDVDASSTNTAQRYEEHRYVTESQVARRRWYLPLLDKQARAKETARLDRLARRVARPLSRAVIAYGASFRRSWAAGSLFDRASAHGLAADYDGYRILSSVIHGSSGALTGIVRRVKNDPVHRTGPDLDLAATAYGEGLKSTIAYFELLERKTQRPEPRRIRQLTEGLLSQTQEVRRVLSRLDRQLWPTVPVPPPIAILAIFGGGRERWYLYYPQEEKLTPALPPTSTPDLGELRRRAAAAGYVGVGGRPLTASVEGVRLVPTPGARSVPAASIMNPTDHPDVARARRDTVN
jgi:hypothetical protein